MARVKVRSDNQPAAVEPEIVEQPVVEQAVEQAVEAVVAASVPKVTVYAKYPPFLDLIKDIRIDSTPIEVELHPWLQLNIDEGCLIEVK